MSVKVSKYQSVNEKGYKKLRTWNKAHEFALTIYKNTNSFPKHEQFGLISQLRRAAVSVTVNIVEGQASISKKEFLNFLNISNRSLVEVEYLLELSKDLGYISEIEYGRLEKTRREIGLMLNSLRKAVRLKVTLTP